MSIRTWSLLGTAIAILPILGFALWIVVALIRQERLDADRELSQRTQAAAVAVKRRLERAESALEALALSPAFARGDLAAAYDQAKKVAAANPDAISISMVQADGATLFSTVRPWGRPVPSSVGTRYEQGVFAEGTVAYTPLFVGSITRRLVMAVSVPVRVDGQVRYSLRMSLPTEALSAVLTDGAMPVEWTSAVVDPNGIIAGRSSEAARLVGRPVAPTLQRAITAHTPCPFQTTTYDDARLSSCAAAVPGSDWVVAIGVPAGAYDRQLRESLIFLLVAGIASLGLGALGAVKIANAIRAQVRLLSLDRTDDRVRPAVAGATIREVADAARTIAASREREGELESELIHAKHDTLTGLPARTLFRELVEFDISRAQASSRIALLFIDLDGFKAVNDTRGHEEGDRLLRGVADAIRRIVRANDVACRFGGDEFLVYLRGASEEIARASEFVAQRLVDQIPASTGLGCSVGVAIGPCDVGSLDTLLNEADRLMMRAKAAGKGRFVLEERA